MSPESPLFGTYQIAFCLSVLVASIGSILCFSFMRLPKKQYAQRIKYHTILIYVLFALNSLVSPWLGVLHPSIYIALSVFTLLPICYGIYYVFASVDNPESPSPFVKPFMWINTALLALLCAILADQIEHSFGITRLLININCAAVVIAGTNKLYKPDGTTGHGRLTVIRLYYGLCAVMLIVPLLFHLVTDFALTQSLVLLIMAFLIHLTFGSICAVILIQQIEINFKESITDGQTQLLNRRYFLDKASRLLSSEDNKNYALIICDLDHFKQINDTYGHGVGDQVIAQFASLMCNTSPAKSLCARLGGEEFALLIPDSKADLALETALSIQRQLATQNKDKTQVAFTASFGATDNTKKNLSQMLTKADNALYEAKSQGRNRIVVV